MQLPEALFNLTNADAAVRHASEDALKSHQAPQLVAGLLQCLTFECPDATTQLVVRSMAAVVLRRTLTGGTTVLFKALAPETQRQVQAGLLEGLAKQTEAAVGRKVCDTIVDIAVVVYQDAQWEELMTCAGQLLAAATPAPQLLGYRILQQLLEQAPPKFTPPGFLRDALRAGVGGPHLEVQVDAVRTYAAAITSYDTLCKDPSFDLNAAALQALERCLVAGREEAGERILSALVDVLDAKPDRLKAQLPGCLPAMVNVCRNASASDSLRRLALDFIASAIEGDPEQPVPVVLEAVQLAMTLMLELEDDPQWASHPGDYDTSEDTMVEAGQVALARLAAALPSEVLLPALSAALSEYATQAGWRPRHAALLAIVQTGDELEDDHVRQLLPYVTTSLRDSNPRIQWAAAQAASQLLTEHGEWLAEECKDEWVPVLLAMVRSAAPRVVAWVCAALRDFCESLEDEDVAPFLPTLLGQCLELLQHCPTFVAEKAFQTVSWAADLVKEAFRPYYGPYEALLFQYVERPPQDTESLRGRAMECLTSVGRAVGRPTFDAAAARFLELTLALHVSPSGQLPAGWSPYYVLGAWRRIVEVLEEDMAGYLPRLVPVLLAVAGAEALAEGQWAADNAGEEDDGVQWVTDPNGLRRCVNPTLLEAKTAACEVLGELMSHCKDAFRPFLGTVLQRLAVLATFPLDAKVRGVAAQGMANSLDCCPEGPERLPFAGQVVSRLLALLPTEEEPEALVEILKALRDTLRKVAAPLPDPAPKAHLAQLLTPVDGSVKRSAKLADRHKSGAIDDDELEALTNWEEAAMLRLVSCAGAFLATHGDAALSAVDEWVRQQWAQLTPTTEQLRWMVTLGLMAELLKVAPAPMLQGYLAACVAQVKDACGAGGFFTPVRSLEVRRYAYAVLGRLAAGCGPAFDPHAAPTASLCTTLLSSAVDEDDEDQVRLRDTAAATLAQVAEHHAAQVPNPDQTLAIWLDWLPIKRDDDATEPCVTFMCRMALAGPFAPSSTNTKSFSKVLAILSELDPTDEDHSVQLKALVRSVVVNAKQLPADVAAKVSRGLNARQRHNLEKWHQ